MSGRRTRGAARVQYAEESLPEVLPDLSEDFVHENVESWEQYVSPEVLQQVRKLRVGVEGQLPGESAAVALISSKGYQFFVAWLNNVCESYITGVLHGVKLLWRGFKFDESLLWQDLFGVGEGAATGYYEQLRAKILAQLAHGKQHFDFAQWDELVPEQLEHYFPGSGYRGPFMELPLNDQFEVLYRITRIIEMRSMVFKNYLTAHLDMFQQIEYVKDDATTVIVLPTHGGVLEKTVQIPDPPAYLVPLKLRDCTLRSETPNGVELRNLDTASKVDVFMQGVSVQYTVKAYDWRSFLQYVEQSEIGELHEYIESKLAHRLYAVRLHAQLARDKSMEELVNRRKRSSRLVAREEVSQKKEKTDALYEKVDHRHAFLKNRHRIMVKCNKKLRDVMWSLVWTKFDTDFKLQRPNNRHLPKYIEQGQTITPLDTMILQRGQHFTERIVPNGFATERPELVPEPQEIPSGLCISQADIAQAKILGIEIPEAEENTPDSQQWIFRCMCTEQDISPTSETDFAADRVLRKPMVCCEVCHTWQHWACQPPQLIELLSQMQAQVNTKKEYKHLTIKNFAVVSLGPDGDSAPGGASLERTAPPPLGSRRSTRIRSAEAVKEEEPVPERNEDHEDKSVDHAQHKRPTDRREQLTTLSSSTIVPFICSSCVNKLETELRWKFVPELEALRLKQRKGYDDRERRKKKKLAETATAAILNIDTEPPQNSSGSSYGSSFSASPAQPAQPFSAPGTIQLQTTPADEPVQGT
ncbi:Ioc2p KNAG_0G02100 [Huiozyma naganishii CBS 8797]|uniref:Uncharacterized protein n=1 Tax=Huiozyma naganishii (strain ATCC MYA-139 / BCRC 22969 / CBS 8797 / KCTC 17520 / NBRC 10181 / NCYC 3082 / Yp74L-3) TaxID=1071383 RepID=J7S120_HUIN7|nr:hypothetical protein KNAG_0G02100 [Kazachstania naganishii CBS 8797]CCK71267.1 hypothetical protein KNAG_0G02100 [Kazachstania naganishii CBS 8797]